MKRIWLPSQATRYEFFSLIICAEAVSVSTDESSASATDIAQGAAVTEIPPKEASADPWSGLLQLGAELVSALTTPGEGAAPHPWVERDPATGARSLKLPLPPPETLGRLADALSAFSDALRPSR